MAAGGRPPIDVKSRLLKFGGFLLFWAVLIVVRLAILQVLEHKNWVQQAEHSQQHVVDISPQRGIIYDRNGQELAMTVQVDSIFAVPSEIPDTKNTATLLAAMTGDDADSLLERLEAPKNFVWIARKVDGETATRVTSLGLHGIYLKKDSVFAIPGEIPDHKSVATLLAGVIHEDPDTLLERLEAPKDFVWVARKVDGDVAARVASLGLHGIYFQKEPKRFYPKRGLAAQVLGYVGTEDKGLAGIEHKFQDQLNGVKGHVEITMDARRKRFGRMEQPPKPGSNIVLTIDEKIQFIAEKELEQAMQDTKALAGTVVVQNPRTGEILALANAPSFNPNLEHEITPEKLKNHALSDVYEPGSVFKTVTYSSVFEEKLARPEEVINCDPGFIVVGGIRIRDSHHIGTVTLEKAYAESSDVGAVKMALRLGPDRFYKHIHDYGFGQLTNVELPGETRGLVRIPSRWAASSIGSMAIGQEVGVTPLQVISMMSSVANDGIYSSPRILAGVTSPDQGYQRLEFHPQAQRRVISSYTAALMRRLTEEVVLEGTARRAILDGYTSAGKTGTAQKIDPRTHAYSKTDYVASFVGFAPVNNPALTIAVILDSPRGLHQGGQVSAPVFKRVAEQVLAYYGVPHDVEPKKNVERRQLVARAAQGDTEDAQPHALGQTADLENEMNPAGSPGLNASAALASRSLQAPAPAAIDARGGTVVLDAASGSTVPSLLGLSMREAIGTAHKAGFELQVVGSGTAREQQPPAGAFLPTGSTIAVRFGR